MVETYRPVDRAPDERWMSRLRVIALTCLALATLIGIGTEIGIIADIEWLRTGPGVRGVREVPASSAMITLLVCYGLWATLFRPKAGDWARLLLLGISVLGVIWLIFTLIASERFTEDSLNMLPSSPAAFGLSAVSIAAVLQRGRRGPSLGQVVAILSGAIALVPLTGYLFGVRGLVGFPFGMGEVAILSAVQILLLSLAAVFGRPDAGLLDVVSQRSPGGVMLRRLVLPVLLLPPALIVAIRAGETRPLRTLAWTASAISVLGVGGLIATARTLNRWEIERRRAHEQAVAMEAAASQEAAVTFQIGRSLGMLGEPPPAIGLAVRHTPAQGVVGGDAYSFFEVEEGTVGLALVDIASKGADAALAAVRLRDVLTSSLLAGLLPSKALESACWLVKEGDITATSFVAVIDTAASEITYASAGHVPAMHKSGGVISLLEPTGSLFHSEVNPGWRDLRRSFDHGHLLMVYTDGVADVVTRAKGGTTIEALMDLLSQCPADDPEAIVGWCFDQLEISPHWTLDDDSTLMVLQHRRPPDEDQAESRSDIARRGKELDSNVPA